MDPNLPIRPTRGKARGRPPTAMLHGQQSQEQGAARPIQPGYSQITRPAQPSSSDQSQEPRSIQPNRSLGGCRPTQPSFSGHSRPLQPNQSQEFLSVHPISMRPSGSRVFPTLPAQSSTGIGQGVSRPLSGVPPWQATKRPPRPALAPPIEGEGQDIGSMTGVRNHFNVKCVPLLY